jgi:ABC-2 type transport system ATP-binding protein
VAVIEARGLGKRYGGKPAVDDLSFDVRPGSVTGFLGPNGAGKSTTMRLMLGLDKGDGTTTFDGRTFRDLGQPMREVGALLEAKPFHPTRKARNHLKMLAVSNGISGSRVDEVLALVGLSDVAGGKPKNYSMGMGQRLGLAAALLGDPPTLILDEPANGLDPQGITWLRNLLKELAGQGRSIFVSSHLLAEMALMADALVVVGRGRLIASGPVDDFVRGSTQGAMVVRTPEPDRLAGLLRARGAGVDMEGDGRMSVTGIAQPAIGDLAFEAGIRLHELSFKPATLEEAFLEATGQSEEFVAHGIDAEMSPR